MSQIREQINTSNHKIHSHDQMGEIVFNLSNNKCGKNNKSTGHLNQIQNFLLMSIVDIPDKDVSNVHRKAYKKIIRT